MPYGRGARQRQSSVRVGGAASAMVMMQPGAGVRAQATSFHDRSFHSSHPDFFLLVPPWPMDMHYYVRPEQHDRNNATEASTKLESR